MSVKEFLLSVIPEPKTDSPILTAQSTRSIHHLELARVCLRYLSYEYIYENTDSGDNKKRRPFLKYAAKSWHLHKNLSELDDLGLCRLATKFLDKENANFHSWAINFELNSMVEPGDILSKIKPSTPLYYAALNLVPTMEDLHKRRHIDLNLSEVDMGPLSKLHVRRDATRH